MWGTVAFPTFLLYSSFGAQRSKVWKWARAPPCTRALIMLREQSRDSFSEVLSDSFATGSCHTAYTHTPAMQRSFSTGWSDHCRGLDILPHRSEGKGKAVGIECVHINWHAIQCSWLTLIWKGKTPAFVYLDTNYFCLIVHSKPNPHWLQTSKIHVCGAYMIIPGVQPTISGRYSDRSLTDGSEDTSSF